MVHFYVCQTRVNNSFLDRRKKWGAAFLVSWFILSGSAWELIIHRAVNTYHVNIQRNIFVPSDKIQGDNPYNLMLSRNVCNYYRNFMRIFVLMQIYKVLLT